MKTVWLRNISLLNWSLYVQKASWKRCVPGVLRLLRFRSRKNESTVKSFQAGFRHRGCRLWMAWERRLWEDLIYFSGREKLWEKCPIHPANSAFQGAGKKLCLSRIYRVRTTAVSICKTAEENHLNIDRNIISRLLSYLAGTSPLFKSGSHVKAISSTSLKEWHTVKQSDSQGNFVFGEGFKILHLVCHVTGEKERLKTIHLKKLWREKAKCSL